MYKIMAMSQLHFLNTITSILGLSVKQREVLSNDGCNIISAIIHWKYGDIHKWFTTKLKTTR